MSGPTGDHADRFAWQADDVIFTRRGEPRSDAELDAAGYFDVVLDEDGWPTDYGSDRLEAKEGRDL
jgi:hypothetical protein